MANLPSAKSFGKALMMGVLVVAALKVLGRTFPALKSIPVLGEAF